MQTSNSVNAYAGKTAVVIGGGVIGASWAALFLVNRLKVIISDPDPEIESKAKALITAALPALKALGYETTDVEANLSFEKNNAQAVAAADIVQECAPEKVEFKQALWKTIEEAAPKHALLFSSSSTIPASAQFTQMVDQSRLLIGHPFNPPHLMPLVEVVPTPKTDPEITAEALAFYEEIIARYGRSADRVSLGLIIMALLNTARNLETRNRLEDAIAA